MAHATFLGLPVATAPGRVMTPRPASERLVEAALDRVGDGPARVVDVGTGSGALAIAIAALAPEATVWATDTSRRAVALAKRNARVLGLADRVVVRRGDLLAPVAGPIDVVVANLPYLPSAEAHRRPELRREPRGAVFATGDGLGPYRRLLAECEERLGPDGFIAIQLHRHVLTAARDDMASLYARMERIARSQAAQLTPRLAGAAA